MTTTPKSVIIEDYRDSDGNGEYVEVIPSRRADGSISLLIAINSAGMRDSETFARLEECLKKSPFPQLEALCTPPRVWSLELAAERLEREREARRAIKRDDSDLCEC